MSILSWLQAQSYDRMMSSAEQACLHGWRAELVGEAEGDVLELGAGTGLNLEHYRASGITRLVLAEPDAHMRMKLRQAVRLSPRAGRVELRDDAAEALRFPDESFDVVVATLILCTVADPTRAVSEMTRVLRPGGCLLYLEHVAAEGNEERLRWQRRLEPAWKQLAGNCHLTRRTHLVLEQGGLELEGMVRESMRKAFPWVRPTIRGVARKPAAARRPE